MYKIKCSYCKEIVERQIPIKNPCCFGCKKKRHQKYAQAHKKYPT